MPLVPVSTLLVGPRSLDDRKIVARSCDKLQAGREVFFGESAGDGKRWKTAEIADASKWVRKDYARFQIQFQGSRWNGLGSRHQHIEGVKHFIHLFLQN